MTLIELMIGISVFLVFSLATAEVVTNLVRLSASSTARVVATALAVDQIEMIRNIPYIDVGTIGGVPNGLVPQTQVIARNNQNFTITTSIKNIDDPFDGTIEGNPAPVDTAPADYRLAEVIVSCDSCPEAPTIRLVTRVAPAGLEIGTGNGALFIYVIDATGQAVPEATVHITNDTVVPAIDLTDTADINGQLQLIDVPPAINSYHIEITKNGYSSDSTLPATVDNPNPTKQDWTVQAGVVSKAFFAIDKVSTLNLTTMNSICTPLSSVSLNLAGSKQIGDPPPDTIFKYDEDITTDGQGRDSRSLEWDTYTVNITDARYDLIGTVGTLPIILNPDSSQDIFLILGAASINTLHVTVKDATTLLPLSDATVQLTNLGGYDQNAITGRGYLRQTNWSGGSGQTDFSDETKYFSDNGNVDISTTDGQVTLREIGGQYALSGEIESSSFDTGGATNFTNIIWSPVSQPLETGASPVKWQLATNNDNTTWDYLGPDGSSATYYTSSNESINAAHNNSRYLRYKLFLSTDDNSVTPIIADFAASFTSGCVPPGQVFFSGMSAGDYTVNVSASDYDATSSPVSISGATSQDILLNPL